MRLQRRPASGLSLVLALVFTAALAQDARIAQIAGTPAWSLPSTWRGSALTPAPPPWGSPAQAPVCLVERQALDGGQVHVVTARGFSPDWRGDVSQNTLAGSSAWLQSLLLLHEGQVRNRAQRRILQPPVR
jgi:hypothetical protein